MTSLAEQLPYTMAFPHALGTGLIVQSTAPAETPITVPPLLSGDSDVSASSPHTQIIALYDAIDAFIDVYESTLSRFRANSLVSQMRSAQHGGTFDFPVWCVGLFDLYDQLFEATAGAIDPCVGEDLIRLGYDATYSFSVAPDAFGHADDAQDPGHLGAIHGRPTWRNDVERQGATLITHLPVSLDFGACGKGYLVDLIARMLAPHTDAFVIDAGGDLLIHTTEPVTIALEDPEDTNRAVGTATVSNGAFCASAPSRRHWGEVAGHQLHHLLNAIDGLPVDDVAATWVTTPNTNGVSYLAAQTDGLATALFTTSANQLHRHFDFDCAILNTDRTAAQSPNFPGRFFTA
ncbi:FAD:protein FMN transferase [Bifidobacterium cebidarum]|uniref:FAD:protein FMN transferase n=1 Tax=Bifidobacterium cebidarum TaxID=2650773 RepID=A0A6I1GDS9_9BIFI|nr:FAD:protein FMN transferase [Bifidobacterium cebidarum]KAB7786791.1 thiamine biosynthesis lipoprotein ApbE [Bifidobacterium cebidarum]